jgi:hypothetical protein
MAFSNPIGIVFFFFFFFFVSTPMLAGDTAMSCARGAKHRVTSTASKRCGNSASS